VKKEGAVTAIVAPKVSGIHASDGGEIVVDEALYAGPSVLFDAVILLPSDDGVIALKTEAAAVDWLRDAFGHLKVIGYTGNATPLLDMAQIEADDGVVAIESKGGLNAFIEAAKRHRIWAREPKVRDPRKG
jgi:catalase